MSAQQIVLHEHLVCSTPPPPPPPFLSPAHSPKAVNRGKLEDQSTKWLLFKMTRIHLDLCVCVKDSFGFICLSLCLVGGRGI